ncbi:MAG: flagellar filament capping protein FliD [Clostridiales bacterium]|nr:flagellar filament capping protein FliD [Clostridiales bacterium]
MPIRITGMNSGLDTEAIITELMKVQKTKVDNVKKQQTKLQWKQDAWKELNTKVYSFFNSTLNNMRTSSDYSKKTTDISDSSLVKVVTGDTAMNAVQKLSITELAASGYLTGGQLTGSNTKNSKLTDLGITAGSSFSVTVNGKTTDITVTDSMTIGGLITSLQGAGVDANFDEKNQRFHISSRKSGKDNDFAITASNANGMDALSKLKILSFDENAIAEYEKYSSMTAAEKQTAVDAEVATRLASYLKQKASLTETLNSLQEKYNAAAEADKEAIQKDIDSTQASLAEVESYIGADGSSASQKLIDEADAKIQAKIDAATAALAGGMTGSDVVRIGGKDAAITLNGVKYTSTSNVFEVNGLTITVLGGEGKEVTLSTRQDTDGIYDMIKKFIKEYNSLINEMDKLYNAEAAKGYEPLTDDEKEEMSDSEIEKWETKIKDAILRRDSNLSTIASSFKSIMLAGTEVNGKKMYLSDFGIETLGYFASLDNEKNAYHIDGDADDSNTSTKEDKLKAAIASDPDTVISFFSQLSQNLYSKLSSLTSSTDLRSFGSIYDDKKMKEDYSNYKTKIKTMEEKLKAMEDKWYAKFSAMETALAKLQSNQNAVTSLLGGR